MDTQLNPVPFTFLSSLFRELSQVKPRLVGYAPRKGKEHEARCVTVFKRWVDHLHQRFGPQPPGTTAAIFRLVFPEDDAKRKYDMQESRLISTLSQCFGVDAKKFNQWDASEEGTGCLGRQVRVVLDMSNSNEDHHIGPFSLVQVDELLTELAALSGFSAASIREKYPKHKRRRRNEIIRDLYRNMGPEDASYLTQIILKDLRPLLYPLEETHPIAALTKFNTKSVTMLTRFDAMRAWDPSQVMLQACRVWSDLDRAATIFETPAHQRPPIKPTVGVMVDIPKSKKGQSCQHSLHLLQSSRRVWAETKYDGERTQIHVNIPRGGGKPHITIFSKSKRDSTLDRHAIHDVIREALGFSDNSSNGRIQNSVILDAEMVAFDGNKVDEFWRIRRLIETTAYGIRGQRAIRPTRAHADDHSQSQSQAESMKSDDDSETRQLGLVFFDVLALEEKNLLFTPYCERRRILETIIQPQDGRAILASRFPVDMTTDEPECELAEIMADHIADHQEGLVLKADESMYNDWKLPWVKLKKDYIPHCGDTVDMVLVGASWEKSRGWELRVPSNTMTTFYFGALDTDPKATTNRRKPHIEVIFTASYGLNRNQLADLNVQIQSANTVSYPIPKRQAPENYTFNLYAGLEPPSVILQEPLLVELFGAGFTKSSQCPYYELRWPRISKIHRRGDRDWKQGLDLRSLHNIACESVGRDRSGKDIEDDMARLFGKTPVPGAKCFEKRKANAERWAITLLEMDGRKHRSRKPSPSTSSSSSAALFKRQRLEVDELRELTREEVGEGRGARLLAIDAKKAARSVPSSLSKRRKVVGGGEDEEASTAAEAVRPLSIVTNTVTVGLGNSQASASSWSLLGMSSRDSIQNSQNVDPATPVSSQVPQLPTPSTTPTGPREKLPQAVRLQTNDSSGSNSNIGRLLQESFVWIMQNGGTLSTSRCVDCSKLKKHVTKDRRLHTIDSLLNGCGWIEGVEPSQWVPRGTIIVETHSPLAVKQLEELLVHLQGRLDGLGDKSRKPISVLTCNSERVYNFV